MKGKHLLLFLMLCLGTLYGCRDTGTSVLELEFPTDSNTGEDSHSEFIKTNWQASKYETFSDIIDVTNNNRVTNSNSVTMEIKEDLFSPIGATLVFQNDSNKQMMFNEAYILETKVDNIWYEIPVLVDKSFSRKGGYELALGQSKEFEVDWQDLYGELKPGAYRIIKDLVGFRGKTNYEKDYMECEFDIK